MRSMRFKLSALLISSMAPLIASAGAEGDVAQATWKPLEIRYVYTGFTTAYDCDAAESKLEQILGTLGAHPNTRVRATGCSPSRPSRNFFVTITTAIPASADAAKAADGERIDGNVLRDLKLTKSALDQSFPAQRRTVDLSRERKLDLMPGDCELLEGLRDHVLPKLSLQVVEDRVNCTPRQLSIQTPTLKVSALVPVKTADQT